MMWYYVYTSTFLDIQIYLYYDTLLCYLLRSCLNFSYLFSLSHITLICGSIWDVLGSVLRSILGFILTLLGTSRRGPKTDSKSTPSQEGQNTVKRPREPQKPESESKDGKRWRMTHRTIPFVSTYSVTRVAWFAYKTNTRHINACIFLAPFVAERSCSHLDRRSLHLQRLFAPCSPKYQWPTVACHFHTLRFHSLVYLIIFDICWKLKNVISLRVLGKRRLYVCQNPPNTIAELTFMVSMTFFVTYYNVLQNVLLYYTNSNYVLLLFNFRLCYIILSYIIWYFTIFYYITLHYIILYYIVLYDIILHYTMLCYITSWYIVHYIIVYYII